MMPRTIVVTGASGFLGSWVVSAVAAAAPNDRIVGIGRRPVLPPDARAANVEYLSLDLLRSDRWSAQLPGRADALIHLAGDGRTYVPVPEWTGQLESNVTLTSRMVDYAASAGAAVVLYASSVYVYSGVSPLPFTEDRFALPVEQLGATKLAAESLLRVAAAAGQFQALALRIFTAYGPRSREEQFIPQAIRKLVSPEPVVQFRSPEAMRDFVYAGDVAAAFVAGLAAESLPPYAAVNIASGRPTKIRDVISLLAQLLGARKTIEFLPEPPGSPPRSDHWADLTRSQALLGWRPAVSLEAGLRRTVDSGLSSVMSA